MSYEAEFANAMHLLKNWGCSEAECGMILGEGKHSLQRDTFDELRSYQVEKVMHIIRMDELLRRTFMNEDNVNNFMKLENQNTFFDGKRPIDFLLSGDVNNFEQVVARLETLGMGLW